MTFSSFARFRNCELELLNDMRHGYRKEIIFQRHLGTHYVKKIYISEKRGGGEGGGGGGGGGAHGPVNFITCIIITILSHRYDIRAISISSSVCL